MASGPDALNPDALNLDAPNPDASGAEALHLGVRRLMVAAGAGPLSETPLPNGRRADVMAVEASGDIVIVEIKASLADFLADRKWPDYKPFCDRFYFATAVDFPPERLPQDEGWIVADRYGGEILRPAPRRPLAAARRKAMLIRLARAASQRLAGVLDPAP